MSVLCCDSLCVVRSQRTLVDRVSLNLQAGELIGMIGPNGAGKSTLLSVLAGLTQSDSGSTMLCGRDMSDIPLRERSRLLAWVAQSGPVNWPLTVERIITLGRHPHLGVWQKPATQDKEAIERAIQVTDCEALRHQDATTLSGGERTRMLLARALAAEPQVLLADEPIAALDLRHQLQTMELLRHFARVERSCLVVLHDLSLAARYCDRVYLIDRGRIVAHGVPAEVLTQDNLMEVYGVEVEIGGGDVPWIVPVREVYPGVA